jgi:hypothetical protein
MRIVFVIAAVAVAFVLGLVWLKLSSPEGHGSKLPPVGRGESINSASKTNLLETSASENQPSRKKRPKPASFQHRMVEFQVSQAGSTDREPAQAFGGNPAKVIFTPAQLKAFPEPPLPPGYQRVGFDTLSAFLLEVTSEMADGSTNLAAASAAARTKIPASVQALDDQRVAIRGFLLPLKMNNGRAIEILLMRNQNMCCFGTVPKVNEWIAVAIPGEGTRPVMDQPVTILGTLHVGDLRENGYLVGIYRMEAEKIYWPDEIR